MWTVLSLLYINVHLIDDFVLKSMKGKINGCPIIYKSTSVEVKHVRQHPLETFKRIYLQYNVNCRTDCIYSTHLIILLSSVLFKIFVSLLTCFIELCLHQDLPAGCELLQEQSVTRR